MYLSTTAAADKRYVNKIMEGWMILLIWESHEETKRDGFIAQD